MSATAFGQLMNRFYDAATDVLIRSDAFIDKLIGDEVIGLPGCAGRVERFRLPRMYRSACRAGRPEGRKFVCRELAESPGAAARIADGDQEAAMMRNYVMRSRMYRARRVAGGGCLVLSPATTNAGGCVSRAARV